MHSPIRFNDLKRSIALSPKFKFETSVNTIRCHSKGKIMFCIFACACVVGAMVGGLWIGKEASMSSDVAIQSNRAADSTVLYDTIMLGGDLRPRPLDPDPTSNDERSGDNADEIYPLPHTMRGTYIDSPSRLLTSLPSQLPSEIPLSDPLWDTFLRPTPNANSSDNLHNNEPTSITQIIDAVKPLFYIEDQRQFPKFSNQPWNIIGDTIESVELFISKISSNQHGIATTEIFTVYPSLRIPPELSDIMYNLSIPRGKAEKSIWVELKERYVNAKLTVLLDSSERFACLASLMLSGNCDYYFESMEECVLRHSHATLSASLSLRCLRSRAWVELQSRLSDRQPTQNNMNFSFASRKSLVHSASICHQKSQTHRAPLSIDPSPFGPPRKCHQPTLQRGAFQNTNSTPTQSTTKPAPIFQSPISFGAPLKSIQTFLFPKLFDFMPIPLTNPLRQNPVNSIPKHLKLDYNDEDVYQSLMQLSYYCPTHASGGWDAGRHHEILASGCVPYFIDIHAMPPKVLSNFPITILRRVVRQNSTQSAFRFIQGAHGDVFDEEMKELRPIGRDPKKDSLQIRYSIVRNGHGSRSQLYFPKTFGVGEYTVAPLLDSSHNTTEYWEIAKKLLQFTAKYLSAESVVQYVLNEMGLPLQNHDTNRPLHLLFIPRPENMRGNDKKQNISAAMPQWDNMASTFIVGATNLGVKVTVALIDREWKIDRQISDDPVAAPQPPKKISVNRKKGAIRRDRYGLNNAATSPPRPKSPSEEIISKELLLSLGGYYRCVGDGHEVRNDLGSFISTKTLAAIRSRQQHSHLHGNGGWPWANKAAASNGETLLTFQPLSTIIKFLESGADKRDTINSVPFDGLVFGTSRDHQFSEFFDGANSKSFLVNHFWGLPRLGNRIAMIDSSDSGRDPEQGSKELANIFKFFSRELRRQHC